ncbi:MAG TPA: hypothetical protein VGM17_02375 [Rhizomicrobium sp.]|jgi:hypothetical protein
MTRYFSGVAVLLAVLASSGSYAEVARNFPAPPTPPRSRVTSGAKRKSRDPFAPSSRGMKMKNIRGERLMWRP